jgi:AAA15 family ATPase/GTPase
MLQNIKIQNFRCFETFYAEGFERINLIGGKNNSGKTCLLEALACLTHKFAQSSIAKLRDVGADINTLINKNTNTNILSIIANSGNSIFNYSANLTNDKKFSSDSSIPYLDVNYITQNGELPALNILNSFDEFDAKLIKGKLIKILQVIDNRIEDMRTFSTKAGLYIKLKDSDYEPLYNFGDATKNLIRYFTPIFEKELLKDNGNFSILLIDEIENGIHYTAHHSFWESIFKLSKELNVQVFATTHSLEMIKAFNEVAKTEGEGAYFEMAREYETGQIFAQKHDADLLEYELEKTTATFRGE